LNKIIVLIIYKILFCFNKNENFENEYIETKQNSENIVSELKEKNKELGMIKDNLQNKLIEQSQAIYKSQNFDKVDESSFNDEITYLLTNLDNTKFPEVDMENKKIVQNQMELNNILVEATKMKNFYKPGDIVNVNSTFNINKDNICYRHNNKSIKPTPEFIKKYPDCMVCSIENNNNLERSNGWEHTKTNISKVCLYDSKAKPNSGIPNLNECKKFCNISNTNN
jgi:hypothetical protein